MIFIIGCDRSGTHMVADLLDTSARTIVNQEGYPFAKVLAMARSRDAKTAYYNEVALYYRNLARRGAVLNMEQVEKVHMLKWFPDLMNVPEAKVIEITRACYPSVVSMIRHKGVVFDIHMARAYRRPCPFMGAFSEQYYEMPDHMRVAAKWGTHHTVRYSGKPPYLRVQYEMLTEYPGETLARISEFTGLTDLEPVEVIKSSYRALGWKRALTPEEREQVDSIIKG